MDREVRRVVLELLNKEAYSDSLFNVFISQFVKSEDAKNDSITISAHEIDDGEIENIRDYFDSLTDAIISKQIISESELLKLASENAERIGSFLINKQKLPAKRNLLKVNEIYENEDDDWVKC
jgi:hypothetical protein